MIVHNNSSVLSLIGKNPVMIVILIRMLVVRKETSERASEREREKMHSLKLVSFQTHQGAYLYAAVVVVVHTVASNSHIG